MNRRRGFAMIYGVDRSSDWLHYRCMRQRPIFHFNSRRTRVAETDSQLHQFLLAGNDYVTAEGLDLAAADRRENDIAFPADGAGQARREGYDQAAESGQRFCDD